MLEIDLLHPRDSSSLRVYRPCAGVWRRRLLGGTLAGVLLLLILEGFGWYVAGRPVNAALPTPEKSEKALRSENAALRRKLDALAPKGLYVVVDTAGNRVSLRKGEQELKSMLASCGSGNVLEDPVGGRTWVFDTPRGSFRIQSKINRPVWMKPDWAFIEEGEPIPARSQDRAEPGMMGEYALGIGQGYFIHGTLYTRLLGRNVSHGCVRLGDQDLKDLVNSIGLGTQVLIF